MEKRKETIGIYISRWNAIGGVETSAQNFCKRMSKHYNITLLYNNVANENLVTELKKYCNVIKADFKSKYIFDIFISTTAWDRSAYEIVNAKCYVQIVHADYRVLIDGWAFNYRPNGLVTHHVCVGETVKNGFEHVTKLKSDAIIYNLLDNTIKHAKKPKNKALTLITCSRLSGEKGFKRMKQLARQLDAKGIEYIWNVWGDTSSQYAITLMKQFVNCPNVHFKGITTEPHKEINKADYLVQLSDTEGFAYSVYEAMQVKTPCIITPFASGKEQITNGVNGYIVPFEMDNIPFDDILRRDLKVPEFEELGKEEHWISFFDSCLEWYKENVITVKIIAVVQKYKIDEIVDLPKERALSAIDRGLAVLIEKPID